MGKCEIWIALRNRGYSPYAVAAILGNAQAESGYECDRVQGDFSASREYSKRYTAQVDSGEISRYDFAHRGPNGGGYGLMQWTYPARKEGLYDTAKRLGVSIGSEKAAVEWLCEELNQPEYGIVQSTLRSDTTIYEMTKAFMCRFERPADQSQAAINSRAKMAAAIYEELSGVSLDGPGDASAGQDDDDPERPEVLWPPRMVDENMEGPDVQLFQAALLCHGYSVMSVSGLFDASTTRAVKAFQSDRGLKVDGVIGPITGEALLRLN